MTADHGGLKSETFGNDMVHGLDYNRRLQAKQVTLKQNSSATTPLQQYDYGYGEFNTSTGAVDTSKNNGQIGKITGTIGTTTQWLQGFRYDELGRLSNVSEYQSGNMSSQTYSQSYTYDLHGNRFQNANSTLGLQSVSSSEINAASNRFINSGSTPTSYDAAGNITTDTKFRNLKYDYDANGRQSAVKLLDNTNVQSSIYDCAGQRVQTSANGTTRTMVYDIFGQDVADYLGSSGATLERENIYRGGQLLATSETLGAAAPSALTATPSSTNVALSWSTASGASNYRVERRGAGGSYGLLSTTTGTSITDSSASSGSAYLYRVCAADGAGNCTSSYSNIVLGAAVSFTDSSIVTYAEDPNNATTIKAVHITELRTAVNAVRSLAGLSSATWTNPTLTAQSSVISADDVRDLRTKLDEALTTLAIQISSYTDATLATGENGTIVKRVHITELRQRATSGTGNTSSGGSNGGLKYVLSDLQGTARALMNNNGSSSAIVARHDYLPFGEEIGSGIGLRSGAQGYNASDNNRQKYALTERDNVTGLDHTWFRKYENRSGRWTSPDPYNGSATTADPQSFNRYSYTQNDPVNFVDPSGLFALPPPQPDLSGLLSLILGRMGIDRAREMPIETPDGGIPIEVLPNTGQTTTPPTDCQRFADRVAQIASGHNDVGGFVNELARIFIGVVSADIDVMRQRANSSTGEYFSSTGFREGLFDKIRDNQARHFMGGLIAGYNLASVTLATAVMNHNEDSQADRRVNGISIPLGARLTNPRREEIVDRGDRGGWRRIPATPGFKALADAIRNQVCAR